MNFKNKIALITGAANGLGKAYAQEFASRGIGKLILNDLDNDKLVLLKNQLDCEVEVNVGKV